MCNRNQRKNFHGEKMQWKSFGKRIREVAGKITVAVLLAALLAGDVGAVQAAARTKKVETGTEEAAAGTPDAKVSETEKPETDSPDITTYTVTVHTTAGGTVLLDGKEIGELAVESGSRVELSVCPEEGFLIEAVYVDDEERKLRDAALFEEELVIEQNTEITVSFVKTYTVTVFYEEEKGTVITCPEQESGAVTVREGTEVTVEAKPKEGYRVLSVVKNGVKAVFTENNESYADTISDIRKNYRYEIVFARNVYHVTANKPEEGSILIAFPEVLHGEGTNITITPREGYVPESVKVNGKDAGLRQKNNEQAELSLEQITGDMYIEVKFCRMPEAGWEEIDFPVKEAVRVEENRKLYVFSKESEAVFSTKMQGLKINGHGNWQQNTLRLKATTVITQIELFGQSETDNFPVWHKVRLPEHGIKIVFDETSPAVIMTPDKPSKENYYNQDVGIKILIEEPKDAAGIKAVEYWVEKDGDAKNPTQSGILFADTEKEEPDSGPENAQENAPQEKAVTRWTGTITVDAKKNNSCKVVAYVKAIDCAGNERVRSVPLDIDVTAPTIRLTYDNNEDHKGNAHFDAPRTATITVTERTAHFDSKAAAEGIRITAKNGAGEEVPLKLSDMLGSFTTTEGKLPEEAEHTATIHYEADANYTFFMEYSDRAGNKNGQIEAGTSKAPYRFTVDRTAPTGSIWAVSGEGRQERWDSLAEELTFGFQSGEKITLSAAAEDATSSIAGISYYKTAEDGALKTEELEAVTEWQPFEEFAVTGNEQFAVYLKITDMAGNVSYISTNGLMVDNQTPKTEVFAPEVTVMPEQPLNGLYRQDVRMKVRVEEPVAGGSFSGIRTVSYRVLNMGSETQSGTLYAFTEEAPGRGELQKSWSGEFLVDAEKNNSNEVTVEIFAEDCAGNSLRDKVKLQIDVTPPKLTVSYDNNRSDSGSYYSRNRAARIVVTERNFHPEEVQVAITNSQGSIPVLGPWEKTAGDGNGDNTTYTATVRYEEDGDYTFSIACKDLAGNTCAKAEFLEGSANPTAFTLDKTLPRVQVGYDNNSAQNGTFFREKRRAVVTVTEHDFDAKRVEWTLEGTRDGIPVPMLPPVWRSDGDVHTAILFFEQDGDYTFDVRVSDLAGNTSGSADYGSSVAGKAFTVDTGIEKLMITGVEEGHAYNKEVAPSIGFSDINFSDYEIRLTRTGMYEGEKDVTGVFSNTITVNGRGGSSVYDAFEKIRENDGIYTLYVGVSDKAGNEREQTVTFSVNRFGSVYVYGGYLQSLIADGGAYVQALEQDLVITEYNVNRLVRDSLEIVITCDGKPMPEVIYHVAPVLTDGVSVGESGWFQYRYTIAKENFFKDGVYKLAIASKDAAGNTPENTNREGQAVLFWVDSTPPEITGITGLKLPIVDALRQKVGYTVFDAVGLKAVRVYVNGKPYGNAVTDFSADSNQYRGSFVLEESAEPQSVRLVVEDLAGNVTDTEAEEFRSAYPFQREITVSSHFPVRRYADRPLFWGAVGAGCTALAGVLGIRAVSRRRKRKKGV